MSSLSLYFYPILCISSVWQNLPLSKAYRGWTRDEEEIVPVGLLTESFGQMDGQTGHALSALTDLTWRDWRTRWEQQEVKWRKGSENWTGPVPENNLSLTQSLFSKDAWMSWLRRRWVERVERESEMDSHTSPLGELSRKRNKEGRTWLILALWPHGSWGPEWPIVVETCVAGQFPHLCVTLKQPGRLSSEGSGLSPEQRTCAQDLTIHVGRAVVHKYPVPTVLSFLYVGPSVPSISFPFVAINGLITRRVFLTARL